MIEALPEGRLAAVRHGAEESRGEGELEGVVFVYRSERACGQTVGVPLHPGGLEGNLHVGVLREKGVFQQLLRRGSFFLPVISRHWTDIGSDALLQELEERLVDALETEQALGREMLRMMELAKTHSLHRAQHKRIVVQLAVRVAAGEEVNHRHAQCVDVHGRSPQPVGKHLGRVVADAVYA